MTVSCSTWYWKPEIQQSKVFKIQRKNHSQCGTLDIFRNTSPQKKLPPCHVLLLVPRHNKKKIWGPGNKGPKYERGVKGKTQAAQRFSSSLERMNRKVKKAMWNHPRNQNAWHIWPLRSFYYCQRVWEYQTHGKGTTTNEQFQ